MAAERSDWTGMDRTGRKVERRKVDWNVGYGIGPAGNWNWIGT